MMPITHLTIHCAATPEGRDVKADTVCDWDKAKFGQISYHHIVELDGSDRVTLPDDVRGAHVAHNNTGNIGVCYIGGMDKDMHQPKDTRTTKQKATLKSIVLAYEKKYPGLIVRGHNEWPGVTKACPSFSVAAWLKADMPL